MEEEEEGKGERDQQQQAARKRPSVSGCGFMRDGHQWFCRFGRLQLGFDAKQALVHWHSLSKADKKEYHAKAAEHNKEHFGSNSKPSDAEQEGGSKRRKAGGP